MIELTQNRLDSLREQWKLETDVEKKKNIETEGLVIKAYLGNPKWGSTEVGGNGYCYECKKNKARVGHYNCLQCAVVKTVNYQARTRSGMQQALLEWSREHPKDRTLENALEIFKTP